MPTFLQYDAVNNVLIDPNVLGTESASNSSVLSSAILAANSGIVIDNSSIILNSSGLGAVNIYDGSLSPLGIGQGLLLTSGTTPGLSNTVGWFGQDNSYDPLTGTYANFNNGDPLIDAVVNSVFQTQSYDATTLKFNFTATDPTATSVSFDLVFGSEEYPEWVDQFVDCAIVVVNGVNYAYFNHDSKSPLSVIGSNLANGYFQDNAGGILPIEYDGVSKVLKIIAPINSGINSIEIGIADTGDHIYDSGLFISNLSAGTTPGSGIVSDPSTPCDDTANIVVGSIQDELINLLGGDDVAYAGAGDDIIVAGAGADTVYGGTGNDVVEGDGGSDSLDGGEGTANELVYQSARANYQVTYNQNGTYTVTDQQGADGVDTVSNFQLIKFTDGLYDLGPNGLTAHQNGIVTPLNVAGTVVIGGATVVGNALTALTIDPNGIGAGAGITYDWSIKLGQNWVSTGINTKDYVLSATDAGKQLQVVVSYTDADGYSESITSSSVSIAQAQTGLTILPMTISAPAGASVMDPITTLLNDAIGLGYTANEAAQLIKAGLGIDQGINLATYDAYAILSDPLTSSDSSALAFLKIAGQVAMTASVSDPSGLQLTLAAINAGLTATPLNLTSSVDLAHAGVGSGNISFAAGLNIDMNDAGNFATISKVWNDWAGQKNLLKPFLNHLDLISVHINQAPIGSAPDVFQQDAQENAAYTINVDELLAGYIDPEGGALNISQITLDQGGIITKNVDDSNWTYTPNHNYVGPVEISFTVEDVLHAKISGSTLLIVQASSIPPVNQAPVFVDPNSPSTSVSDYTFSYAENSATANVLGVVQATDPDFGDVVSYSISSNVLVDNPDDPTGLQIEAYAIDASTGEITLTAAGALAQLTNDYEILGNSHLITITATDGIDYTDINVTLNELNVNDNAPTGSVNITGSFMQGQTLTASNTLADLDGLGSIAYQWYANGIAINSATAGNYLLTVAEVGKTVTVVASYHDGSNALEAVSSAPTNTILSASVNLVGTAGIDTLTGGNGNDTLNGGASVDKLDGRNGSDVYLINATSEHTAAEIADTGTGTGDIDEVRFTQSIATTPTTLNTLTLYAGDVGIERAIISDANGLSTATAALNINAASVINAITLVGNDGNNILTGSIYNDTLIGGGGNDSLTGGAGADTFVLNAATNGTSNLDTLIDFASTQDSIWLDKAIFTALASNALGVAITANQFWSGVGIVSGHDVDDRIVYNTTTGALYYDADGNAASGAAAVQIAIVGTASHPTVSANDIFVY